MYTIFCDSLKYYESVSLKQCGHPQPTFLLCPDKLCAAGESLIVTNKMTLRPKYSCLCSSQTCTPLLYHSSFRSSTKGLKYVLMSFPGCCGPGISPDIIIYFCLLHNQGGRIKIVSTIGHVLCVLLFMNGFMPSVLNAILIFLGSMVNSVFHESMFHYCVTSAGCLIILMSYLCFSLCHHNNSDSLLFVNQRFQ
jgi:hypothetical protein